MTTLETLRSGTSADGKPPGDLGPALQALWWVAREDWKQAHECVQGHEGQPDCDWVHAHLHRVVGDLATAGYWYRRAKKSVATGALTEEWEQVARALLAERS